MTRGSLESTYRRFLLGVTLFVLVGAVLELYFAEHAADFVQLIPFGLAAIGAVSTAAVMARPKRASLIALRIVMFVLAAGSAYGVYEHLSHNVAFQQEIRPNIAFGNALIDALFGASPLLAPGVLGLAALLGIAATYRHPALQ
jgi:predicted RND superfamily exporter protein